MIGHQCEAGGELKEAAEMEEEAKSENGKEHLNSWVALSMLMHCSGTERGGEKENWNSKSDRRKHGSLAG